MDNVQEIKSLIDEQGKAFEAFKAATAELKKADAVTADKLARIEKSLDDAVEAKAKIEARIEAEKKEREALELRLSRGGRTSGADEAKAIKAFDTVLRSHASRPMADLSPEGYDAYKAAQATYWRKGKDGLLPDEIKAMSVGGDPQGGYFVTPDVSGQIVTRVYESSPIRQIANVVTISTDKIEGIEDLGEAGVGWVGETTPRPETTTPEIGKWSIVVGEMYAEPRITQRLLDDSAVDVEGWLATKVGDRFGRFEARAFVRGEGIIGPRGFTDYGTALDDGSGVAWGTIGHVLSGANGAFAASNPADPLHDLTGLPKDEYLGNARWVTRRAVIQAVRKFRDGQGQYLWQPGLQQGVPESLLGYPITRAEDMPALATGSRSLAFGDFRAGYTIVDRQGIRTMVDPYTAKPFVKYYSTKRVGGAVVNFEAIKVMVFSA